MGRNWTKSQEAAMSLCGKALLVSAAAGSGKTSVLTERIIRRITDRENPADITRMLVVTFTRAAAAELKSRIAAALTDALAKTPNDRHLTKQLLALGGAQISTIDSFFQRIVRSNFEELLLPANFRIADDSEMLPIAIDTMDGLIEEFYLRYAESENGESMFERIENNRFAKAMDHLLSNRSDGKLTLLLYEFFKEFSAYPEGIGRLRQTACELKTAATQDLMESVYGETLSHYLEELFCGYLTELKQIKENLAADPDILQKCSGILSTDEAYCNAMLDSLRAKSYEKLQSTAYSFLAGRFPSIRNKPDSVIAYQEFRAIFRKEIASKVQAKLEWPADLVSIQLLQTAELCEMLYLFYSEYEKRLMAEKKSRGILEYDDIRAMLYGLLSNESGERSEFAKNLAAQYDEVYIDEYQDVDLLQDRIFELIGGTKRFMVGDIKQSIYGFRGSDPSIFSAYRRMMPLYTEPEAEKSDGICVFMSENFRCDLPVIKFANHVCGFLFSACEKNIGYRAQDDLVCAKSSPCDDPPAFSPVQVAIFDPPVRQEKESDEKSSDNSEAVWVAKEISHLLREEQLDDGSPITPSDIVILVRAKSHGVAFANELKKLGIPVAADVSKDLLREPIVIDLLNLLRAVDNPYRDLPLSEFLLSPLGHFSLEELTEIRESAPMSKALYHALIEKAADQEDPLGAKAVEIVAFIDALRSQSTILPADRFLRRLYAMPPVSQFENDPALLFLYEQARVYQRSSWCGLYGFLQHVDKLLEGKPLAADGLTKAESAVTIMTVHHSKGLEFPVVFLSSCGSPFNRNDTRDNLLFHRNIGCASKLYISETGNSENTILREIIKQEIETEQAEEDIRTLYVALTRARERLYVTGSLRGKRENALAAARNVRRGNRNAILSCGSYLSWMLAAEQELIAKKKTLPCVFQHFTAEEIVPGIPLTKPAAEVVEEASQTAPDALNESMARVLNRQKDFVYRLDFLRGLPTKAAASKLSPHLVDTLDLDRDQEEALETQIQLMEAAVPSFETLLFNRNQPSAAEIGTATHAFLEFCDYDLLLKDGIEQEKSRLVEKKFLSPATAELIQMQHIEAFCKSNLMRWIQSAKAIHREQKFGIYLPFSRLTESPELAEKLVDQQLFVQGSIDLLLEMPNGELYLIDYKTDRLTSAEKGDIEQLKERMQQTHGTQLSCYAKAVAELFGRRPDKTFIYSLPLGEAVELSIESFW